MRRSQAATTGGTLTYPPLEKTIAGRIFRNSQNEAASPARTRNESAKFARENERLSFPDGIPRNLMPAVSTIARSIPLDEPTQRISPFQRRFNSSITARPG
jgi:hypothetical protein